MKIAILINNFKLRAILTIHMPVRLEDKTTEKAVRPRLEPNGDWQPQLQARPTYHS
jgi:hypothetical protein